MEDRLTGKVPPKRAHQLEPDPLFELVEAVPDTATDGPEPAHEPSPPQAQAGGSTQNVEIEPPPLPETLAARVGPPPRPPSSQPATADETISSGAFALAIKLAPTEQLRSWRRSVQADGILIAWRNDRLALVQGSASGWTWAIRQEDLKVIGDEVRHLLDRVAEEMGLSA